MFISSTLSLSFHRNSRFIFAIFQHLVVHNILTFPTWQVILTNIGIKLSTGYDHVTFKRGNVIREIIMYIKHSHKYLNIIIYSVFTSSLTKYRLMKFLYRTLKRFVKWYIFWCKILICFNILIIIYSIILIDIWPDRVK